MEMGQESFTLFGIIDWEKGTITFSGDTYRAKEELKSVLGARWNGAEKEWVARSQGRSLEELQGLLPYCQFSELEQGRSDHKNSTKTLPLVHSEPVGISVFELLSRADAALRRSFGESVLLYGVIAKVNPWKEKVFIELRDAERERCVISAEITGDIARILSPLTNKGIQLQVDLQVMFEGSVTVTRSRGNVSFSIKRIIPEYTVSKLQARREETNARLRAEGVFDRQRALRAPLLPMQIGLLTSLSGTVINDFRGALATANFGFELSLINVTVQGELAKREIVQGLEYLSQKQELDLVLVFRGGGSPVELGVFNEYEIARAVALCPVPVWSAVGHLEDQCSVQDVSNRSFGVPRDLGRELAELVIGLRRRLGELRGEFTQGIERVTNESELRLSKIGEDFTHRIVDFIHRAFSRLEQVAGDLRGSAEVYLTKLSERLRSISADIISSAERIIERADSSLTERQILLTEAAPERQLARGYAIIKSGKKYLPRGAEIPVGAEIEIQFSDTIRQAKLGGEVKQ